MTIDTEVLIVGAGPTGLVTASQLQKHGVKCRIIDSLAEPSDKSRALAIHARTLEILDIMGIVSPFIELGWKSTAFAVYSQKTPVVRMTFEELDSRYAYMCSLPQSDTERILTGHLSTVGGTVEWGKTVVALRQTNEFVEAEIENVDGTREKLSCRWLVGCDGANSAVRRALALPFPGLPHFEQYVLADVMYETSLDSHGHYLFSGPDGVAGFHPFSKDCARIYVEFGKVERSKRNEISDLEEPLECAELSLEMLQSLLDKRGPGSVTLTQVNWQSMHQIHLRQVVSYRKERVFLAGDSAHVHGPTGGQGINMGIQDAFNLAWKIALVQKKYASDSLLDSYSIERHLAAKRISAMSDFFTQVNEVRTPLLRYLRNEVGTIISKQENVRESYRRAVSGLSTDYRYSPVVDEVLGKAFKQDKVAYKHSPPCGHRAPDFTVVDTVSGERVRLFKLMESAKHQLIVFIGKNEETQITGEMAEVIRLINTEFADYVEIQFVGRSKQKMPGLTFEHNQYFDEDLGAHRVYGAHMPCLYLIRPDGYVAFRSAPIDVLSLRAFLKNL